MSEGAISDFVRTRRIIGRDTAVVALVSIAIQILYLIVSPISINGYGGAYLLVARYFGGDPKGGFLPFRPPCYPLFLLAGGLTWLHSFGLIIALQAGMGAACPLFAFAALRDVSRKAAVGAALLLAFSGIPFAYAKSLNAEHVFLFWLLAVTAAFARFLATKRSLYAALATGSGFMAMMTRNEGLYVAVLAVLAMMWSAWGNRRRLRAVVLSAAVAVALVIAWSACRALILGNPSLFGALDASPGVQLFARVYWQTEPSAGFWRCMIHTPPGTECGGSHMVLVRPENGAATRRLAQLIHNWAARSGYEPDSFVADYFARPMDTSRVDKLSLTYTETVQYLGYRGSADLLLRTTWEAARAHPEVWLSVADAVAWYFGVSLENLAYRLKTPEHAGAVLFANWQEEPDDALPENIARGTLTPPLWRAYQTARAQPTAPFEQRLRTMGQTARSYVRNAVGLALLVTWPALFWIRPRALALFLLLVTAMMLGIYAMCDTYNTRFEHIVLPFMIMAAALAVNRLALRFGRMIPSKSGSSWSALFRPSRPLN